MLHSKKVHGSIPGCLYVLLSAFPLNAPVSSTSKNILFYMQKSNQKETDLREEKNICRLPFAEWLIINETFTRLLLTVLM